MVMYVEITFTLCMNKTIFFLPTLTVKDFH